MRIAWLMLLCSATVFAQPAKPIRIMVPSGPGAGPDLVARTVAPKMSEALEQPVVVENRPGAGTVLAATTVASAPPDGTTLLFGITATFTVAPSVIANPGYDPVASFTPISLLTSTPFILFAAQELGVDSVPGLVDLAKAKPGAIGFGATSGTLPHLAGFLFMQAAGVQLTHVPYKSVSAAYPDLVAGRLGLIIEQWGPLRAQVQAAKVRALVVASAKRHPLVGSIPSATEAGIPTFDVLSWFGLLGPRGLPPAIVKRLNEAVASTLEAKEIRDALIANGLQPTPSTPEGFKALIETEATRWPTIVKAAGVKQE